MKNHIYIVLLSAIIFGSCTNLQKISKNPSIEVRYDVALEYYEDEDYAKASILFYDLIPDVIGKPQSEKVQYYYAYCEYYQGMYEAAAYYFKTFHDTYQRSPFAKEALFMSAYSQVASTPVFNLDQSNTTQTIVALQDFINRYPNSEYVGKAEAAIKDLRLKLEKKSFEIARQYQRLRRYKAAVIAYDNFRKSYPDSYLKEEAIFNQLESQYELVKLSYANKEEERLQELVEYYYHFIDKYPNSKFKKKAESYFDFAQEKLGQS